MKTSTPIDELCRGLPPEFAQFLTATRALEYTQKPNYTFYRQMFRDLFVQSGFVYDYQYDWAPPAVIARSRTKPVVKRQSPTRVKSKSTGPRSLTALAGADRLKKSAGKSSGSSDSSEDQD
jgi:hypothetical protein